MDVDQVVAELYAVRPQDFVAARNAHVAEARRAKDPTAAQQIARLRRPTTAAWASNLFVRARPQEAERLLALGETLREAHRTLDAGQFREANRQQHQMIAALAQETAALAKEAGLALTEAVRHEVEQILHTVLADPAVAQEWAAGRLAKAPEATVDFTAITPDTVPTRQPAGGSSATKPAAKKRPGRQDAARRERLQAARTAADGATAEATRRDEERAQAEQAQRAADTRVQQTSARVTELEEHLRQARKDQREARAEADLAQDAAKEAGRAATNARRTAARAAARLAKLEEASEGE